LASFPCGVKDHILHLFDEYKGKKYTSQQGLQNCSKIYHRREKAEKTCLEAGIIGFISETILKEDQVLLSDRAGQFSILIMPLVGFIWKDPCVKFPLQTL